MGEALVSSLKEVLWEIGKEENNSFGGLGVALEEAIFD